MSPHEPGPTGEETTPPFGGAADEPVVQETDEGFSIDATSKKGISAGRALLDQVEKLIDATDPTSAATGGIDPTNPEHYCHGDIECIDALRAALTSEQFQGFCRGNVIKYAWRSGHKHDPARDLRKAAWYASMAAGDDPR